jgi:hypothetical protein
MVKISYTVLSGARHDTLYNQWSLSPTKYALESYYTKHKKDFVVGYVFTLQGLTMKVTKIQEKSVPKVYFSG